MIVLPACVSAGVLAYGPLGHLYIGFAAAAGIVSGVAGSIVGALARSPSFVMNIPSAPMALIQAGLVGSVLTASGGDTETAVQVLPLSVAIAGVLQVIIGTSGLARAVKFTPYPVLAGFVTGLAILTFERQLPPLFGAESFTQLQAVLTGSRAFDPTIPLFGLGIVALTKILDDKAPRWPAMFVGLAAGVLLYHAAHFVAPELALGPTVGSVSLVNLSDGLELSWPALRQIGSDPDLLWPVLYTSLTLAILGALDLTTVLRGAQNLADFPIVPQRDIAGQGLSNIASAAISGVAVTASSSSTASLYGMGGRSRLAPIAAGVALLAIALAAPRLISWIPSVVLAALLVFTALKMWDRWCVSVLRDIARPADRVVRIRAVRNAVIVVTVMLSTVFGQPVIGALVGVILSCLVFILEMSRPVVRRRLDGATMRSKRIRSQHDVSILAQFGSRTAVLDLQGVLFFGNAEDLASQLKGLEGLCECVVLDLKRVSDIDSSGASILRQAAVRSRRRGMLLLAAGPDPSYLNLIEATLTFDGPAHLFPGLDSALEFAEERVLAAYSSEGHSRALELAETDLGSGLTPDELEVLRASLVPCRYPAAGLLCRAGEDSDRMWLIARGSVSIWVSGARSKIRIAALGSGTSVGEMGLLDRRPRSADVVADEEVEAYMLTADAYDRLLEDTPRVGQSLLATIARVTAQRLRATSEELRLVEA